MSQAPPSLRALVSRGEAVGDHGPWKRAVVDEAVWREAISGLAGGGLTLLSLWAEVEAVHMALFEERTGEIVVLSLRSPDGLFPSVGAEHPAAIRLERAIFDCWGLEAEGAIDTRPWLDHGRWGVRHPLWLAEPADDPVPYRFLPAEGEGLHQVAVGPVHAGIIEPGHFRFTANGETVVRLEERLGWVHRGLEGLMTGAPLDRATRLAARASGDSTVAYSVAFARAVEAAMNFDVPPRAHWLRALMMELERLANHLGDIGAVCNDASFALMHAHCSVLRERVLRASHAAFGHRLMMDVVAPGGVVREPDAEGFKALKAAVVEVKGRFPSLAALYDDTASLQDRTVGAGFAAPALARAYGAGGFVGRASGRGFDARSVVRYAPYADLRFETPFREDGDVNARVWIRIDEVGQSLSLVDQLLGGLPQGPGFAKPPSGMGEGMALVEGFRGDVLVWLRIAGGRIARCHLRDPSWFQWPLLEASIEANIIADFPLCNKSFNCSYAGCDL